MAKGLRTRKKQRFVVVSVALSALFGAVFLIIAAMGDESFSLFMQPSEAVAKNLPEGKRIRLGGLVEVGSFKKQSDGLTYTFIVTDCVANVNVQFKGLLPDLFREGQGVVTEGTFGANGLFTADSVLAKHDENYMPPESAPKNAAACEHPENTSMGAGAR